MELMFIFFWIGFSVIVAVAANTRGRSAVGWFILAILISPLLAGLLVLASKNNTVLVERFDETGASYMIREKIRTRTPEQDRERTFIIRALVIIVGALFLFGYFASPMMEVLVPKHAALSREPSAAYQAMHEKATKKLADRIGHENLPYYSDE
jgi:hypothetical protein